MSRRICRCWGACLMCSRGCVGSMGCGAGPCTSLPSARPLPRRPAPPNQVGGLMNWARKRAIDVHDETAGYFSAEYASDNVHDSAFRYGRSLIDELWWRVVEGLPAGAHCLDIGSGIGAYMARLLEADLQVRGIEPSGEMRKLAQERVPEGLVTDGSVTDLPAGDRTLAFIYAIEVVRYLDTADNMRGHREIFRALKPGGVYFGTYVNRWA